jgi:hypothetical protein
MENKTLKLQINIAAQRIKGERGNDYAAGWRVQ